MGTCSAGDLAQRGERQREVLHADTAEVDRRLERVRAAPQLEHDALAEGGMLDVVTDAQVDAGGVGGLGRPPTGSQGGVDDAVAGDVGAITGVVLVTSAAVLRRAPAVTRPNALAPVRAAPRDVALRLDELGRDLVDEPRRRVVLRRAEEAATPGMGDEQPITSAGDADVGEAAFLLQLFG